MNKKFNLLALAAAASACGALVLTSCGGGGKTHLVYFVTNDLRNEDTYKFVDLNIQKVKDGKYAKTPEYSKLEESGAVRWTYTKEDEPAEALTLKGFSYNDENQIQKSFSFRDTPITKNTVLYPIYLQDVKVHCLTLEIVENANSYGTWIEEACNENRIWDDNYIKDGVTAKKIGNCLSTGANALIKPCPNHHFSHWYVEGDETRTEFNFNQEITEDIVLVAHYEAN